MTRFLAFACYLIFFILLAACSLAGRDAPIPAPNASLTAPAIPEVRALTLAYPASIPVGGEGRVTLAFEMESAASGIQDVFETHNVVAEARLEMAGVEARPATAVSEPLLPGQPASFFWSVIPSRAGEYEGMAWFYLRFVPKDGGTESRRVISAQQVEIRATSLLGLDADVATWLGLVGMAVGLALAFPSLEGLLKRVWGKVRQGQQAREAGK